MVLFSDRTLHNDQIFNFFLGVAETSVDVTRIYSLHVKSFRNKCRLHQTLQSTQCVTRVFSILVLLFVKFVQLVKCLINRVV